MLRHVSCYQVNKERDLATCQSVQTPAKRTERRRREGRRKEREWGEGAGA